MLPGLQGFQVEIVYRKLTTRPDGMGIIGPSASPSREEAWVPPLPPSERKGGGGNIKPRIEQGQNVATLPHTHTVTVHTDTAPLPKEA